MAEPKRVNAVDRLAAFYKPHLEKVVASGRVGVVLDVPSQNGDRRTAFRLRFVSKSDCRSSGRD